MAEPDDDSEEQARALLVRHVEGDREAFGELAELYYPRLWSVALRMSNDPDEAADALQDAMIAAMRGAANFRGDSRVGTWLHRIVVNACLDRHRRRKRIAESPYPEEYRELADPTDHIARLEMAWQVEQALKRLPDDQRAAVVLVDVEGWSVAEASAILGIPEGTVKSRCSRARGKLSADLAHLRNRTAPIDVIRPGSNAPERTDGGEG